ncbi:formyltransferase family protein [Hymenobacter rubidus]|uniref:formyltransferase family protein n=1 Tax=Hymenobacter rubidus TaxID=1441626 RepID=UPI00191E6F70|nr:formyltransferase family protein [Hymenobacter rubidus]
MPPAASPAKVTLFLMTEKGYTVLRHIIEQLDASLIDQVIGAQDPHLTHDYFEEIKNLCQASGIPFASRTEPYSVTSTYALAISWRWLIREIDQLIVLHDSILPRYRGFAPLVSALINGENQLGVTALWASGEYDRGPIIQQAVRPVSYPLKIAQAISLAIECYKELINSVMSAVASGSLPSGEPQQEEFATYSLWRDEQDYRINWQADCHTIKRFIDALGPPYQGASAQANGALIRVFDAEVEPDVRIENRTAGKVLFLKDQLPVVVCGTGLLRLTQLRHANNESALPLKQFRTRFT